MFCNISNHNLQYSWSVLVLNCTFYQKILPQFCMDMRRSNPCVNFGNVCAKSCTVRTYLTFCLFVKYFSYYTVQVRRMKRQKVSYWNHVALDSPWHYYWYFAVLADKFASKTHAMPSLCITIFDHFPLCLQISLKVVLSYCWNKGKKWWNIFYKTYVHFGFCSNSVLYNLGKQNTECLIFYKNVLFFLNLGFV